jgi:hypothetical protein
MLEPHRHAPGAIRRFPKVMSEKAATKTDNATRNRFSQIVYFALTLILFCCAAHFRFQLPQAPFIDPDVRGYLVPALSALAGHGFEHVEGRSFVYPGIVFLILKVCRHFSAVTLFQHMLGLGAGGLLLVVWIRAGLLLGKTSDLVYRFVGLSLSALFLFNTSVLRFEYLIRPEAIFPFFFGLSLWFNIEFVRYRYFADERGDESLPIHRVKKNSRAIFIFGVFTLFNSGLLFYMKPSFFLASFIVTTPVCVSLADRKEPLIAKFQIPLVAFASIFFLLILPDHLIKNADTDGKTFLPTTLFLIHAGIIRDQLKEDIERKAMTRYPIEFLESTYDLLSREMALSKQTGRYHSLGFDPDYLMYRDSFDRKFARLIGSNSVDTRVKFYGYYYFRAWTHQPVRMLRKVATELSILYNSFNKASPYKLEDHDSFATSYADNLEILIAKLATPQIQGDPLTAFERDTEKLKSSKAHLNQPKVISWANRFLARSFTLFIVLAIGLGCFIARNPILRARYGAYVMMILLFYGCSFFNSLGIAIIHTLEITRYLTSQVIYCLLPQFMTMYLAAEFLLNRLSRKTIQRGPVIFSNDAK